MSIENQEKQNIISSVIENYEKHSAKESLFPQYLPDKAELIRLVEILKCILFPGYFNEAQTNNTKQRVDALITEAEAILRKQICRALNFDKAKEGRCENNLGQAQKLCYAFLSKLPEIRDFLLDDVQAAYEGDPAARSKHEIMFAYPGIAAVSIYRLAHELYLLDIPLIPRIITEYAHSLTGIDIHPGATIGRYFFIDHGTGVVIGETTQIGNHVKIYQGVTLGALSTRGGQNLRGTKRHPTLEDEVTVYSGVSVLGGETVIGKGSVIGGNVFLTQSVPAGTRVSIKNPELNFKSAES